MSIVLVGSTSGSITLQEPAIAGSTVLDLPATSGTVLTSASPASDLPSSIKGPAFSATRSSNQTISSNTWTKAQLNVEEFDTNSCYDSSTNYRFTPNVAGYYQVNGRFGVQTTDTRIICSAYKNGTEFKRGLDAGSALMGGCAFSALIYLNGSTDYIEMFVFVGTGQGIVGSATELYFQASMVRSA